MGICGSKGIPILGRSTNNNGDGGRGHSHNNGHEIDEKGFDSRRDDDDEDEERDDTEGGGPIQKSKNYLSSLSPSVTLQHLLNRPNLGDMKTLGPKVVAENVHHLRNVFAKPFDRNEWAALPPLPIFAKTEDEKAFLIPALKRNFVFDNLPHKQIFSIVQALEYIQVDAETIIISMGDPGDFFYVLFEGTVEFTKPDVDDSNNTTPPTTTTNAAKTLPAPDAATAEDGVNSVVRLGQAGPGDSFGELALLYDAPRAATVTALTHCALYRVSQVVFRHILQQVAEDSVDEKTRLLKQVDFLQHLSDRDVDQLAAVMTPRPFVQDEQLFSKGEPADVFWIFCKGQARISDVGHSDVTYAHQPNHTYEDITIGPGAYLGESTLLESTPIHVMNVTALEDGLAFVIDKDTFMSVLGDLGDLIRRCLDRKKLSAMKLFQQTQLDPPTIRSLAKFVVEQRYRKGQAVLVEGSVVEAALYIVRAGTVKLESLRSSIRSPSGTAAASSDGPVVPEIIDDLGFFGEDQLMADVIRGTNGPYDPTTITSRYSVTALEDDTVLGVLTLAVCRKCLDTTQFGKPHASVLDSLVKRQIPMCELTKHQILGAGTFGQVWLVSRTASTGEKRVYALKVQSKYELVEASQAKAVVQEKNIMASLHSPFLINLVTTYQDEYLVYMLMSLIQGGELYALIHTRRCDGIRDENKARFYLAGIAEGLSYMHRRGYVYRDLKPENVLIDDKGYPTIVDFGFAKFVEDKTYTLCGTPLYLAPEVILNRGHNYAADNWSYGVLMYEMILGYTPFYRSGMDQSDLFKAVIRGKYHVSSRLSPFAASMAEGLLMKDPKLRLGSMADGTDAILYHEYFKSIDREKLRRKELTAPFIPKIKNPLDATHFEDWSHLDDKTKKKYPALPREKEAIFEKF